MKEQLEHLTALTERRNITIQLVPVDSPCSQREQCRCGARAEATLSRRAGSQPHSHTGRCARSRLGRAYGLYSQVKKGVIRSLYEGAFPYDSLVTQTGFRGSSLCTTKSAWSVGRAVAK